ALLRAASVPVVLKPNAGLPVLREGETVFDVTPAEFAQILADLAAKGLREMCGCCGTTPAHITALREKTAGLTPVSLSQKNKTVISSYTHAVDFENAPILIGERINPTGKKRFKQALLEGDMD
ncbi:MAG: homocysteine S-methyltransferase family protein, partial [Clostridia bacterium]|nr:homocysteine S-methyltransferase family protein [Clostridia bacterium]